MAAEKTPLEVDFLMHSFVGNEGAFFVSDVKMTAIVIVEFNTEVVIARCRPLPKPPSFIVGFSFLGSKRRDQNSAFEPAILLIRCDEKCETENGIPVNEKIKPGNWDLRIQI